MEQITTRHNWYANSLFQLCKYGGPGDLDPCAFPQKDKSSLFNLKDLFIVVIELESREIRKVPVIFLLFLNLKILLQAIPSFKRCWYAFIVDLPLPLKIPSCKPAYDVYICSRGLVKLQKFIKDSRHWNLIKKSRGHVMLIILDY